MNTAESDGLRLLVEKYCLSWSTSPERALMHGELRPIGWNLEVCATHGAMAHEPTPGCPDCLPVVDALDRVAHFILPTERRSSHYEIHIEPTKMQFSRAHPHVAEMTAVITILHNDGINDAVDACENRCLADMTSKLRDLGALEKR